MTWARSVGEALRVNTVLQDLNLSGNDLGEVGGTAVGEALRVNTVLQILNLPRSDLGEVAGEAVGETLLLNSRAFFSFSPCNHFINK